VWGGQVAPGTVRCEDNRPVYGVGARWEGRRDGTASVVFLGRVGVGPGGNKLVCAVAGGAVRI